MIRHTNDATWDIDIREIGKYHRSMCLQESYYKRGVVLHQIDTSSYSPGQWHINSPSFPGILPL